MNRAPLLFIALAVAGCAANRSAMMLRSDGGGYSINVRDYGAIANDQVDDTAAIQRALIDARGNYFEGRHASGSTVFLPAGQYDVTGLEIYTGTTLRGEGQGSFIKCSTTRPAVSLKSHFTHGGIAFVNIENLSIAAPQSSCIASPGTCNSRFGRLAVSSKDVCLAFDNYNQDCLFHDIYVSQTGSGAIRLVGNANRIDRMDIEGGPTPNYQFVKPRAMIDISGDGNEISGCIVEGGYHGIPVAIKGSENHWRNNWLEFDTRPDHVHVLLEDASMCDFDRLSAGPGYVIRMRRCSGIRIGELWQSGDRMLDAFDLDEQTSGVQIDSVNAPFDGGGMDSSRVHALRYYSRNARSLVPNPPFRTDHNWASTLAPPAISASSPNEKPAWAAQLSDGTKLATSIERKDDHSGWRLRIDVPDNPKSAALAVRGPVRPPQEFVGATPFASWRIDVPSAEQNVIVYCQDDSTEFAARCTNSLTAARFPRPIQAQGDLLMTIPHAKPGRYYVSDVRVGL